MPIEREQINETSIKLTIAAEQSVLTEIKNQVLARMAKQVKIPGFRPGKAPASLVEKQADSSVLQSEFLDEAVNRLYNDALQAERLRTVEHPKVSITKFVPFTTLEFTAEVTVVGDVTLADYKKIHLAKTSVEVSEKDVDEVVHNLQLRLAEKQAVDRSAKTGDQVTIDFAGKDAKTNEPVKGADGKDYPLALGSNTFIPGFEENLIGLKAGETKSFIITFPKDYGVKALQNRKVTFDVTVTKVEEVLEPKVDDTFAAKVGPFKTLKDLRADIQRQLGTEKQAEADQKYQQDLLEKIAAGSKVAIPELLVDEEVERAERQIRQNLTYRGQTWQEYLESLGQNEEAYRAELREPAKLRVKIGLIISEIADQENIKLTPEELELRLQLLKGQYKDSSMQAELDKPENIRVIASRLVSEKTIARLVEYATAKLASKK